MVRGDIRNDQALEKSQTTCLKSSRLHESLPAGGSTQNTCR